MRKETLVTRFRSMLRFAVVACSCMLSFTGCQVARKTASLPTEMVAAVARGPQQKQPDPALLQSELLRFTDDFFGRTSAGLDEYARKANTAEAHEQATKWKVTLCTSALGIATGANPTANVVDLLGLATLTRAFVEQEALKVEPRGALGLWLENTRTLETNAWRIAGEVLSEAQQEEFRAAITRWLEENANTGSDFFSRPQEIAMDLRQSRGKATQPGSVFSLVGLDPTAGLDPAVREVTRTRLFAERAMFAMERMPFLLRWQTEMFAGKISAPAGNHQCACRRGPSQSGGRVGQPDCSAVAREGQPANGKPLLLPWKSRKES